MSYFEGNPINYRYFCYKYGTPESEEFRKKLFNIDPRINPQTQSLITMDEYKYFINLYGPLYADSAKILSLRQFQSVSPDDGSDIETCVI